MLKNKLKKTALFIVLKSIKNRINDQKNLKKLKSYKVPYTSKVFDFASFRDDVLGYLDTNRGDNVYLYKFSKSSQNYDIYSSVYALITLGLFNSLELLSEDDKVEWGEYLLSFQRDDGLFVDESLDTPLAFKIHYWGWYHLIPHLIIALDYLSIKPKYDFIFLYDMFESQTIEEWLSSRDWNGDYLAVSNEVMNITVLLQYSRDQFNNPKAIDYVDRILNWLKLNEIDEKTGLWGDKTSRSSIDISKAVKTAYHFIPMFLYDNSLKGINIESLITYTLQTQNSFGSYGACCLTDGCEDIDSLYLLTQLPIPQKYKKSVNQSVKIFFNKVFSNINEDGGFVFKRMILL